jgi:hypothetical protein
LIAAEILPKNGNLVQRVAVKKRNRVDRVFESNPSGLPP